MNKTKRDRGMSATELAEATKEYDLEGAEPKFLSAPVAGGGAADF